MLGTLRHTPGSQGVRVGSRTRRRGTPGVSRTLYSLTPDKGGGPEGRDVPNPIRYRGSGNDTLGSKYRRPWWRLLEWAGEEYGECWEG